MQEQETSHINNQHSARAAFFGSYRETLSMAPGPNEPPPNVESPPSKPPEDPNKAPTTPPGAPEQEPGESSPSEPPA